MERRGQKYHRERLSEALREEIETILEGELADPRIGLATVSDLHIAPDGRSAHVLVSVLGDDAEADRTLAGLNAAKNFIRHELVERLRIRLFSHRPLAAIRKSRGRAPDPREKT